RKIKLVKRQSVQRGNCHIQQPTEERPRVFYLCKIVADINVKIDQFKANLGTKLQQLLWRNDWVVNSWKWYVAWFTCVLSSQDHPIEPHVKPMRRIFCYHTKQRLWIWSTEKEQSSRRKSMEELFNRLIYIGKMFDDVVASDKIKTIRRRCVSLNVPEDFSVGVLIVPQLNFINVDN